MSFVTPEQMTSEASGAAHESGHLGACVLASDVPFSGLGLDIFNRRVQGVSWKKIAEELDLGTPSKARSMFTKLTGITDYQIKGPQLLKLAQGGLDESLTVSLKAKKALKKASKKDPVPDAVVPSIDEVTKAKSAYKVKKTYLESPAGNNTSFEFNKGYYLNDVKLSQKQYDFMIHKINGVDMTPGEIADLAKKLNVPVPDDIAKYVGDAKGVATSITKAPNVKGKWDSGWTDTELSQEVFQMHKSGQGYLKISQNTGMTMDEIDKTIWNSLLKESDGDIWKAYKSKPGSQEGFNSVKEMVFAQRKAGKTLSEVADATNVDPKVVKAITEGNWKMPPAGSNQYYVPKSYSPSPSAGSYAPKQSWGSDEFPRLSPSEMVEQGGHLPSDVKASLKKYTGGYYRTVNGQLRGVSPPSASVTRDIENMDRGMLPTKKPMTVSRGMDREGFGMGHLSESDIENLAGLTVRDRGFMSTSIKEVFNNEIRLILEVPAGAKGYWVQPFSNYPDELEFLLNRDTKIMITKVEKESSGYYKKWRVYGRVIV